MTRMSLDDEPDVAALGKTERISGGEGQLHGDFQMLVDGASYARKNNDIAAFQGDDFPREDISRADLGGFASGQQNITRSDADPDRGSHARREKRCFQNESASALGHRPITHHFAS